MRRCSDGLDESRRRRNGLHSEYQGILDDLAVRGIKTSITSNGLSIDRLDDAQVTRFHSVELSWISPPRAEHDAFSRPGQLEDVRHRAGALRRPEGCGHGTAVMMTINSCVAGAGSRGRELRRQSSRQRLPAREDRPLHAHLRAGSGRGSAASPPPPASSQRPSPCSPECSGYATSRARAVAGRPFASPRRSRHALHVLAGQPPHDRRYRARRRRHRRGGRVSSPRGAYPRCAPAVRVVAVAQVAGR